REDYRELVLDAMIDLAEQETDPSLRLFGLAHIASNLGGADNNAIGIFDGRNRDRNRDQRAVLSDASGVKALDSLTPSHPLDDVGFFALQPLGNEHKDRASDRFLSGIAEHPLGSDVPTRNLAVQILADDGVKRT